MRKFWGIIKPLLLLTSTILAVILIAIPAGMYLYYRQFVYVNPSVAQGTDIGIVFGAAALDFDTPSLALRDRLEAAYSLYKEGKVKKLIVSGDNRTNHYNEPLTMANTLKKLGVPEEDIVLDYAGFRTYDTCVRAKQIFHVNKAILVSQGYHLPRAIFTCRAMGIEATGVYAVGNFSTYYSRWYTVREIAAMYKAVLDVYFLPPQVVLGQEEPITTN